ncbi:MAG: SDR family oxidoreductase [Methylacidiphilales bacterium]|nr:SDR family oxidoreductase [Candidatus Methylacidiphilales bacterium]
MKIDLSGKTALVTGSAGELGRVISLTLAECGADVVLHYMSKKERALEVQKKIRKLRRRAWIVQADLGQPDGVKSLHAQLKKAGVFPDILVNNAVSQYPWKPVLKQSPEDYESQFRTCVMQNVLMAQAFAPSMIKKKWGRIIAISTECAMQCLPTQSAYVAGKRGSDGVLRVLAREIGKHGVTVNQVAPGWTISERDRLSGTERQKAYERNVPLNRRGEDREIAQAVAFLASDLASFITGAWLPVCGGNVMPAI